MCPSRYGVSYVCSECCASRYSEATLCYTLWSPLLNNTTENRKWRIFNIIDFWSSQQKIKQGKTLNWGILSGGLPYFQIWVDISSCQGCVDGNKSWLIYVFDCSLLDQVEHHLHNIPLEVKVLQEGKILICSVYLSVSSIHFTMHEFLHKVRAKLSLYTRSYNNG
jgi:hypothetical protein